MESWNLRLYGNSRFTHFYIQKFWTLKKFVESNSTLRDWERKKHQNFFLPHHWICGSKVTLWLWRILIPPEFTQILFFKCSERGQKWERGEFAAFAPKLVWLFKGWGLKMPHLFFSIQPPFEVTIKHTTIVYSKDVNSIRIWSIIYNEMGHVIFEHVQGTYNCLCFDCVMPSYDLIYWCFIMYYASFYMIYSDFTWIECKTACLGKSGCSAYSISERQQADLW